MKDLFKIYVNNKKVNILLLLPVGIEDIIPFYISDFVHNDLKSFINVYIYVDLYIN